MSGIFSVADRQEVFEYILSITKECEKIIALCQVGSGAKGYHDEKSDLDFVIALDKNESMPEVMEYMNQKITARYALTYFKQMPERRLQCYVLENLLEIDLGFGGYEGAAAWKPAFKVLFDHSGVVEEKMIRSREWMDDNIFVNKTKKDIETIVDSFWARLMHAAVAIYRGNTFRAMRELEFVRRQYLDLIGDRYRLESAVNRELDRLPEEEKNAIRSTFVTGESKEELVNALLNLTDRIYRELEGHDIPVSQEMLLEYFKECDCQRS